MLGNAPVDAIAQATNKPAEAGRVVMSRRALDHAMADHPEDAAEAIRRLQSNLQRPEYYGAPQAGGAGLTVAYYYMTLDGAGRAVVLPVSIDRNRFGNYEARSFFIASAQTMASRLKQRKIFRVK